MTALITERMDEAVSAREFPEPFETASLPDEVVNQRVNATVVMSQDGARGGRWSVGVWMDRGGPDDQWFSIAKDGWRGLDGQGLTTEEARYVAACLYAAALRLTHAAERAAP